MLAQNLYPEYLLIEAMDKLKENPWIEGDFYEGDLLNSVLRLKKKVWQKHKKEYNEVKIIVEKVKIDLLNNQELSKVSKQAIIDALKFFEGKN